MSQTLSDASSRLRLLLCLVAVLLVGTSSSARAFSNPADYGKYPTSDPASIGVGAGRYFTGSPADGYSCEVCHSASPNDYSFPLRHKGLPLDGYIPGEQYKIELSWAEASAQYASAQSQGLNPVATLMAEFIADDGGPAGTVGFSNMAETSYTAFPGLYCSTLAMETNLPDGAGDHYGMSLYVQDTSRLPIELPIVSNSETVMSFGGECTVDRGKDAKGEDYERRCIVAMKPCGAQSVKFTWTAPEEWRGPIWFSAGFVTTYNRSGAPSDEDFVTTLSIPINPGYQGGLHETVVESGCSVARGPVPGRSTRGFMLGWLGLVGVVLVRRRWRRSGSSALLGIGSLLVVVACLACNEGTGLVTNVDPPVGAYEAARCTPPCTGPIECRETAYDSGTPEQAAKAIEERSAMNRAPAATPGVGAAGSDAPPSVKSLGTVTAQFVTTQPAGYVSDWAKTCPAMLTGPCAPHYVTVWVENEAGAFVRTLLGSEGRYTALSLVRYNRLGYDCQVPQETVFIDAMASASLFTHELRTATWDGLMGNGSTAAPAGIYHLRIEVAIDEVHHFDVATVPFMFGDPAPSTMMFPPEPAHTGVTLTYTPTP